MTRGGASAVVLLALLTALVHHPIFIGRIPLPMDLILQFPPWQGEGEWSLRPAPHGGLGDLVTEVYPWRAFGGRLIRQGDLPLWNSYVFLGAPYQAHPYSALFDPVNVLYDLLPAATAWSLAFLVRALLAGLFALLLLRALGASLAGAMVGALGFSFAGFMLVWRGFPQADSALWLPLICYSVHYLRRQPGLRALALAAVAFALPVLAGHPGVTLYVITVGLSYAAFCFWCPPPESAPDGRGHFALLMVAAGLLALALAAVQLLPSLEWVQLTLRSPVRSARGLLASPVWEIASLFYRDAGNDPNAVGMRVPSAVTYSGILTVIAAFASPLHGNRRLVAFLALLLLLAAQVVYGWGPMYWLSSRAPFFAGQHNRRVALVICFCVTALGALGFTALERLAGSKTMSRGAWVPSALGLLVGFMAVGALHGHTVSTAHPVPWRHGLPVSLVLIVLSCALLSPPALRALKPRAWTMLSLTVVAVDVLSFGYGHVPFVPRSHVYPDAPALSYLKKAGVPPFRFVAVDLAAPVNAAEIIYGLPSPTAYDFPMQQTYEILAPLSVGILGGTLDSSTVAQADHRLLDLASVKYVMATTWNRGVENLAARPERFRRVFSRGTVQLFENVRALPRALVVPAAGVEVVAETSAALARLTSPGFDPTSTALCERPPTWTSSPRGRERGSVESFETVTNEIRVTATAPGASLLVLSDSHYPGWRVWVDGGEAELLRVNHAFKGVALEAGRHHVRFRFDPWRFRAGAWISGSAALVLIALAAAPLSRVRAPAPG